MTTPLNLRHQLYRSPTTITDPGSGKTITIDKDGGICPVVTAAAEARTLRRPTKAGIIGTIILYTDGGDLTLTVTGGFNAAGATTVVLDTAGDFVRFMSVCVGGTYSWRLIAQEGATTNQLIAGAGFTSGVGGIFVSGVEKIGSIYKTTIFMDLTGLSSSTTDLDIIGVGTSAAHFGQITAVKNGTLFYGQITCLETPAGGIDDIDFYYATEGTGVFDGGIAALVETAMHTHGGAWSAAAATQIALTTVPPADKYMYATGGAAGTAAAYTAGQFLIELFGS